MHENRETSVAPEESSGRSGKAVAKGRTPDMHAEESRTLKFVSMNLSRAE